MLIDTHAHLDDARFAADRAAVLERARNAGIGAALAVATTATSSRACLQLALEYPMLRATVGLHPNHVTESQPGDWDVVVVLANQPQVVALGETGLDRHWDFTPFATQEEYFVRHLELSRTTGLPVVIHSRDCDADMVRVLRADFDRHGPINGVLHSFASGPELAATGLAIGLYLSFAGMVTYRNAGEIRAIVATVPADRILVETDCPYLAPVPHRGKRNEPAFVRHTAECLAQARGMPLELLAEQTTRNARALFRRWT
ncbi:MAG: TatD family hydrolase [Gemmataceae bacterium]